MIFVAGIQPKTRRLDDTPRPCSSCGSPSVYLKRIDHYLSLFFVPLLPIKRGIPMLTCENCGALLTETDEASWAESVQAARRCSNCGRVMKHDFSYCPHCGTRLE